MRRFFDFLCDLIFSIEKFVIFKFSISPVRDWGFMRNKETYCLCLNGIIA